VEVLASILVVYKAELDRVRYDDRPPAPSSRAGCYTFTATAIATAFLSADAAWGAPSSFVLT